MERFFRFLLSCFLPLPLLSGFCGKLQAQVQTYNNTQQAPNFDFEAWDNPEPWGWNSSSCFEAGNAASSYNRKQSVWKAAEPRPGSKGKYSAKIQVTQSDWYHYKFPFGTRSYEAMGTLTTGTLYYYDSKTNTQSCIYTKTGDASKHWAFSGRPDSIVFWVKSPANGGRVSDMTLYLHSNGQLEDRNPNGTANATVIGSANAKIPSTHDQWVRYSVPIVYHASGNPSYLLLSFTAGNNFRSVQVGDVLYVDDVMLVYKPSLSIAASMPAEVARHGSEPLAFDIPFELTGTMSPFNRLPDNEVIAYLSDSAGDFSHAWEVARMTTNSSGTLKVNLPVDFPDSDNYRLKLVSTNYPLESNVVDLRIYREWYLSVKASNAYGKVDEKDKARCRHGSKQTLVAEPGTDCVFLGWEEDGKIVESAPAYSFTMCSDRNLTALFDTTYTLHLEPVTGANVFFANNNSDRCTVLPGDTARIRLQLDFGYAFYGFLFQGDTLRAEDGSTEYDLEVFSGGAITPLVDSIPYRYDFRVEPLEKLGTVSGSGIYKHFGTVRAVARPVNPYSHFLYWTDTLGNQAGVAGDTVLVLGNIQGPGSYVAVFEEEKHSLTLRVSDTARGKAFQNGEEAEVKVYSAVDTNTVVLAAVAKKGYAFQYWEIMKDGVGQAPVNQAVYRLIDGGHLASDYVFTAVFDTSEHEVAVVAEHGTASGGGQYKYGRTALLTAVADEGYHFCGWESGGKILSLSDSLHLEVVSDTLVRALFELNRYAVDIRVSDTLLGNVRPAPGLYAHFDTLVLEALPSSWGELRYWVVDGDTVSTEVVHRQLVKGPMEILAVFSYRRCTVELSSNNPLYGQVSGGGIYEWGSKAELKAEAFEGYVFDGWKGFSAELVLENPLVFDSIVADTALEAVFSPKMFQVRVEASAGGKAGLGDAGAGLTQARYPYLEEVFLQAAPDSGYEFSGWHDSNGNLSSMRLEESFRAMRDTVLRAVFVEKRYNLELGCLPAGAGVLRGAGRYREGEEVAVSAVAASGYVFEGWFLNGEIFQTAPDFLFAIDTGDVFFTARFSELSHEVSVAAFPSSAAEALEGAGTYKHAYHAMLRAFPAEGQEVAAWIDTEGDTVGRSNPFLYRVDEGGEVTALLRPALLSLTLQVSPAGAGTARAGECRWGQPVRIEAQAAYGFGFSHWADRQGNVLASLPEWTFASCSDTLVVAVFEPLPFEVSAKADAEAGRVEGAGTYRYGQVCELKAFANEHYLFDGWYDPEGLIVGMNPVWEVEVEGPLQVEARFKEAGIAANLAVSPAGAGFILEGGVRLPSQVILPYRSALPVEACAGEGFRFAFWKVEKAEGDLTVESRNAQMEWTPEEGETLTAVFDTARYRVEVSIQPQGAGIVSGGGEYLHGQSVLLQAEAIEGYVFEAYRDEATGEEVCLDPRYAFRPDSSMGLVAVFGKRKEALQVFSSRPGSGAVSGSGLYAEGDTALLSAWSMEEGIVFSHWSSRPDGRDTLSRQAVWACEADGEDTLFACFALKQVLLNVQADAGRGVAEGSGFYPYGSRVAVQARAKEGYHFVCWEENGFPVSDSARMEVELLRGRSLQAAFEPDTFALQLRLEGAEEIALYGEGRYAYGDTAWLIAGKAPVGYEFQAWRDEAENVLSEERGFGLRVSKEQSLTAVFAPKSCKVEAIVSGEGKVEGAGTCRQGDSLLLTAHAGEGWILHAWMLEDRFYCEGDSLMLPVHGDLVLEAVFVPDEVLADPGLNTQDGGTVLSPGRLPVSGTARIEALPAPGYRFLYWTEGDTVVSSRSRYEVAAARAGKLLAHFHQLSCQVRLQASDPQGVVSMQGAGSYRYGQEAQLSITLKAGYVFEGWYQVSAAGAELLSEEQEAAITLRSGMVVEAKVSKE